MQELNTALPNLGMLHYKKITQFVVSNTDWAKENIITLKKFTSTPFLRLPLQVISDFHSLQNEVTPLTCCGRQNI